MYSCTISKKNVLKDVFVVTYVRYISLFDCVLIRIKIHTVCTAAGIFLGYKKK